MCSEPTELRSHTFFALPYRRWVGRIMRIEPLKRQPLFIENVGKCLFG